ncbi:MAG TPA: hypothetical protein VFV50_06760, partial [Bdellovibrionales bacterium]|nr:hypothetical protein [Bdellovibrionales bacterium]
ATSRVLWGRDPAFDRDTGDTGVYVTTHMIRLTGLSRATSYSVQPTGRDRAGNVYFGTRRSIRTSN